MKTYVKPRLGGKSNANRLNIGEVINQYCKEYKSCKDCPLMRIISKGGRR